MQEKLDALVGRFVDVYSRNTTMYIGGILVKKDQDWWKVSFPNASAVFHTNEVHSVGRIDQFEIILE